MSVRTLLRRSLSGAALAVALLAAAPAASVRAGDGDDAPPPAGAEDTTLDQARRRWESLPEEKRERLLHLFRRFRELPPEKRAALRERFEALGGREGVEILRRQIDDLHRSDPDRMDRLRRQGRALADLEGRILDAIPPALRARLDALDPEARQILRARVLHHATDTARRAVIARFATPEEAAALESDDREARGPVLAAVFRRAREETLAPHRERLRGLAPAARREEEDRLFLDALWADTSGEMASLTRRVEQSLDQPAEERSRDAARRFHEWLGVSAEDIGVPGGPRRLFRALLLVPRDRQPDARERVREGLRELRRLPPERRREGLNRILRALVVEFGSGDGAAPPAGDGEGAGDGNGGGRRGGRGGR